MYKENRRLREKEEDKKWAKIGPEFVKLATAERNAWKKGHSEAQRKVAMAAGEAKRKWLEAHPKAMRALMKMQMEEGFESRDKDKSGGISVKEMMGTAAANAPKAHVEHMKRLHAAMDKDKSGEVTVDEAVDHHMDMMKKHRAMEAKRKAAGAKANAAAANAKAKSAAKAAAAKSGKKI